MLPLLLMRCEMKRFFGCRVFWRAFQPSPFAPFESVVEVTLSERRSACLLYPEKRWDMQREAPLHECAASISLSL